MIQQTFQQYALLREEECILKFLHTLATFANIDQESYRCELIVSPLDGMGWGGMGWDGMGAHPPARGALGPGALAVPLCARQCAGGTLRDGDNLHHELVFEAASPMPLNPAKSC